MEGVNQSFQLRLSRLRKGFEQEHDNDNEHDFGGQEAGRRVRAKFKQLPRLRRI
jgi:hypothetical protein